MKDFNLPPDVCADNMGRTVDGKTTAEAVEILESQGLYDLARHLRQGCDLVGHCTVENCVAVAPLTQLDGNVILTDLDNSLAGCVEPD